MTAFKQPSTARELMSLGPIDPVENPYDIYKTLRETCPVGKFGRNYIISSFELASQALLDDVSFSSKSNSPDYPGIGMVFGQTIVGMNGKEHLKHRNLITPAQRPKAPGPEFRQRARNTADRLIEAEVMGEKMTDAEIISFLRLLITGGADTTYHLLGNVLHTLLNDAALLELVSTDRSKLEPLLWESLRWESPVQYTSRQTDRETQIGGVTIPDDAPVLILLGCANRDEKVFPRPEVFDINRDQGKSLCFGFGRHYCAGADFGLTEATIGLNALLDRLHDLRFDPAADTVSKIRGVAFRGPSHLKVLFNT